MICTTQFAVRVAVALTPTEKDWIAAKLAERETYWDPGFGDDQADKDAYWAAMNGITFMATGIGEFIVASRKDGVPDVAADFIQEFLRAFRPTTTVAMTWANTASLMCPGEFNGGAALITAQQTYQWDTFRWLEELQTRLQEVTA
ncbi:MAG: hypothetical protein NT169_08900 [Chloroflexi bacterium]|nr:hypothetical protein [Chloroflexota bacterium]